MEALGCTLVLALFTLTQDRDEKIRQALRELESDAIETRIEAVSKLIDLEAGKEVEALLERGDAELKARAKTVLAVLALFKSVPDVKKAWKAAPGLVESLAATLKREWPKKVGAALMKDPQVLKPEYLHALAALVLKEREECEAFLDVLSLELDSLDRLAHRPVETWWFCVEILPEKNVRGLAPAADLLTEAVQRVAKIDISLIARAALAALDQEDGTGAGLAVAALLGEIVLKARERLLEEIESVVLARLKGKKPWAASLAAARIASNLKGRWQEDWIRRILPCLEERDPGVRAQAINVFRNLTMEEGPFCDDVGTAILKCAADSDSNVRLVVQSTLAPMVLQFNQDLTHKVLCALVSNLADREVTLRMDAPCLLYGVVAKGKPPRIEGTFLDDLRQAIDQRLKAESDEQTLQLLEVLRDKVQERREALKKE